ncbi:MAG: hypothetical protein OEX00_01750 [Gammaproteobacteria bacterium]|nr:hypothetical protein [Gammaproteobacteria bacterium]MDH5693854.1 hypothetical protein [Gammaproteobacteria bacterium]
MGQHYLHITNKPKTAQELSDSILGGDVIAWNDPLWQGPCLGIPLEELSKTRAAHLATGDKGKAALNHQFAMRNKALRDFRYYDEVILWFDHDLEDQLQLIQILNWFNQQDAFNTNLTMINIGHFPGFFKFYGLEDLDRYQLEKIFPSRMDVSVNQLDIASMAWAVFTNAEPTEYSHFLRLNSSCMPFLKDAMTRLLQEFPRRSNGLSLTEYYILREFTCVERKIRSLWETYLRRESRPFLDFNGFVQLLRGLVEAPNPVLAVIRPPTKRKMLFNEKPQFSEDCKLGITQTGLAVWSGRVDWLRIRPTTVWIGGVNISANPQWRKADAERRVHKVAI